MLHNFTKKRKGATKRIWEECRGARRPARIHDAVRQFTMRAGRASIHGAAKGGENSRRRKPLIHPGKSICGSNPRAVPCLPREGKTLSGARPMRWSRTDRLLYSTSSGAAHHQRACRRIVARGVRRAVHPALLALGKTTSRKTVHRTIFRSLTPQGEGYERNESIAPAVRELPCGRELHLRCVNCDRGSHRIKIHPPSGWFFIFGHSPKRYWRRTSAF